MENLTNISAGMNGAQVSTTFNSNMGVIQRVITSLESQVSELSENNNSGGNGGSVNIVDIGAASLSITATQDSIIVPAANIQQTFIVDIITFFGNKEIAYGDIDDGENTYYPTVPTTIVNSDLNEFYGTVTCVNFNNRLRLFFNIDPNVSASIAYTFNIRFKGVVYNKIITLNFFSNENNLLNIELSPSNVLLTENSGNTINFSTGISNYTAYLGQQDVTDDVEVAVQDGMNCEGASDSTNHIIKITSLKQNYPIGIESYTKTDIDGVTTTGNRPVNGYLPVKFKYTAPDGGILQVIKSFGFVVNYLGTFREEIQNDVHRTTSTLVERKFDESGFITATSATSMIEQSAKKITSRVETIESSAGTLARNYAELSHTASAITMEVASMSGDVKNKFSTLDVELSGITARVVAVEKTGGGDAASAYTEIRTEIDNVNIKADRIQESLSGDIKTVKENLAEFNVSYSGITSRISDVEERNNDLEESANTLTERYAVLSATSSGITSRVGVLEESAKTINDTFTEFKQDSGKISARVEKLERGESGSTPPGYSELLMTVSSINLSVTSIESGLTKTGIDIINNDVKITSDNFSVVNNYGMTTFYVDAFGNVNFNGNSTKSIIKVNTPQDLLSIGFPLNPQHRPVIWDGIATSDTSNYFKKGSLSIFANGTTETLPTYPMLTYNSTDSKIPKGTYQSLLLNAPQYGAYFYSSNNMIHLAIDISKTNSMIQFNGIAGSMSNKGNYYLYLPYLQVENSNALSSLTIKGGVNWSHIGGTISTNATLIYAQENYINPSTVAMRLAPLTNYARGDMFFKPTNGNYGSGYYDSEVVYLSSTAGSNHFRHASQRYDSHTLPNNHGLYFNVKVTNDINGGTHYTQECLAFQNKTGQDIQLERMQVIYRIGTVIIDDISEYDSDYSVNLDMDRPVLSCYILINGRYQTNEATICTYQGSGVNFLRTFTTYANEEPHLITYEEIATSVNNECTIINNTPTSIAVISDITDLYNGQVSYTTILPYFSRSFKLVKDTNLTGSVSLPSGDINVYEPYYHFVAQDNLCTDYSNNSFNEKAFGPDTVN